jgi:hypothetical protein
MFVTGPKDETIIFNQSFVHTYYNMTSKPVSAPNQPLYTKLVMDKWELMLKLV